VTTPSLHDALESQEVGVSKADTNASLLAETVPLAAGNPNYDCSDPMFLLSDDADELEDIAIAEHMLESRLAAVKRTHDDGADVSDVAESAMERDLLRASIVWRPPGSPPDDRGSRSRAEPHLLAHRTSCNP
jgi:DNA replicative helicase MCM subunit Mcm2 (Cdc46/Mcm family)